MRGCHSACQSLTLSLEKTSKLLNGLKGSNQRCSELYSKYREFNSHD